MDKDQLPLKILDSTKTTLGIKAVVSLINTAEGREIFKDEVSLWKADSRKRFAERCVEALDGNLPPTQSKKACDGIDSWLRATEERLKKESGEDSICDNVEPREITPQERDEALDLLRDSNLLVRIQEDLTHMGIVDEERIKVLIYLIATSRMMLKGLAGTLKASSSAGKNHLLNSVISLMPPEDVKEFTYLSAKALHYMGENGVKNKLVICTEIAGKEAAEYSVRTLISEPFITCAIPVRNHESGPPHTQEFKVNGPIAYLDTTTSFKLHPENATRLFELYLNEEENQTKDILQQQAREAGPKAFQIKAEREQIKRVHQNAQRILRPDLDVIIPFAHLIEFPPDSIRARRDFPKLLNLIKVIAFLHQYQREIIHQGDKEYIVATLVDYELAHHLVKDTLVETLDDLDKRSRDVLQTVVQKVEELAKQTDKEVEEVLFDRDMVAKWCGKSKNKLVNVFKDLEQGYLLMFDSVFDQPMESGSISTQKRNYRLNKALLNDKPILASLTTPAELRKKWEGQAEKEGQVQPEKPMENKDILDLSHLSLLSPPMEEKK